MRLRKRSRETMKNKAARPLIAAKTKDKILSALEAGKSSAEIAEKFKVPVTRVAAFKASLTRKNNKQSGK